MVAWRLTINVAEVFRMMIRRMNVARVTTIIRWFGMWEWSRWDETTTAVTTGTDWSKSSTLTRKNVQSFAQGSSTTKTKTSAVKVTEFWKSHWYYIYNNILPLSAHCSIDAVQKRRHIKASRACFMCAHIHISLHVYLPIYTHALA